MKKVLAWCVALGGMVLAASATPAMAAQASAAGLPQAGDQLAYVQRGPVVSVYRSGRVLARVTASASPHPGGHGRLALKVAAEHDFAFRTGQFVWSDADGDHAPVDARRKIRVKADDTRTVTIRFDGVHDGDLIWAPRREHSVGSWTAVGRRVTGTPQRLSPAYVQRDAVVSVYKAGEVVARVTAQSAVRRSGRGTVTLEVEALKRVALRPAAFVWVDGDGDRHRPVSGSKVTVPAKSTKTVTVPFSGVSAGGLTWSPRSGLVAGSWTIG